MSEFEQRIVFTGGARVEAQVGDFVVRTDQPSSDGGRGSAPSHLELFAAALGCCAGYFVLSFCRTRGLVTDGISLRQRLVLGSAHRLVVHLDIELPASFPVKYREALVHAAHACPLKRVIEAQPEFQIRIVLPEAEALKKEERPMLKILNASHPAPATAGPAALLLACHGRIRSFTALAARLATAEPAPDAEVADAAARVHRYHAVALPLHQADEELSIAPRHERAARPEVLEALAKMKREHVELDALVSGLLPIWQVLVREPRRRCELSPVMAREVGRAQVLWTAHLTAEEETIFPALQSLEAGELARITDEIRARRLPSPSLEARSPEITPRPR